MVAGDPNARTRDAGAQLAAAASPSNSALAAGAVPASGAPMVTPRSPLPTHAMTWGEREQELEARKKAMLEAKRAAEGALLEIKALSDRGETLSPGRAEELAVFAVTSAITSTDHNNSALPVLISRLRELAPAEFGNLVTGMARSGFFLGLMSTDADPSLTQAAMVMRAQLIGELRLQTCDEIATLDAAMRHWIEARSALARAQRATKDSDYVRLVAVAQSADKLFNAMLQQLRTRHQPRVPTVQVTSAGSVAVQVNQGGPSADVRADQAKPVTAHQVVDVPADGTATRLFDITNSGTP